MEERKSREMKFQALFVCCLVAVAAAGKKGFQKCPKVLGKYPFDAEKVNYDVHSIDMYIFYSTIDKINNLLIFWNFRNMFTLRLFFYFGFEYSYQYSNILRQFQLACV